MTDIHDNIRLLQSLFPKWDANDDLINLWMSRMRDHDQQRVRSAIEAERIKAGRMNSPNLDHVLQRLGGATQAAGKSSSKYFGDYSWQARYDRSPPELQVSVTHYCRLLEVATPKQREIIMQRFGDEWTLAEQDWLALSGRQVLLDKDLPRLASELVERIMAPSDTDTELMRRNSEEIVNRVARAMKLPGSKRHTVADIERIGREVQRERETKELDESIARGAKLMPATVESEVAA